uniref:ARAD1D46750p n=1 Tax=Blastobotrys adeninivorans TaxID=409370 RepID=A0A060TCY8_BLAAD
MDRKLITIALQSLLPTYTEAFPADLVQLSGNIYVQSKSRVPLRPEEEPARMHLCANLAIQRLEQKLDLPAPSLRQTPIPVRSYQKMLTLFRNQLNPSSASNTPLSTPRKSPPKRTQTPRTVTPSKRRLEDEFPKLSPGNEQEAREGSPSPTPSPSKRRGGPKESDPTTNEMEQICNSLGVSDAATAAVAQGYKMYNNLVKDRWGLFAGLVYTIVSKAQPELIKSSQTLPFEQKIIKQTPSVSTDRVEEWIAWCQHIVVDQTWVRAAIPPEVLATSRLSKRNRRLTSGIGNMITSALTFTSQKKIDEYQAWKQSIYDGFKPKDQPA